MNLKAIFSLLLAVLAISLTACGGSKPPSITEVASTGNVEVTTPAEEFINLANKEYSDHYFGIGDGVSTRESMAYDIASAKARNQLAIEMQTQINSKLKTSSLNTMNDDALETTMQRIIQETQTTLTETRIQKRKTLYNENSGKFTVYVLVTVPQKTANKILKGQVSNDKAISDARISKAIMDFIDAELDK